MRGLETDGIHAVRLNDDRVAVRLIFMQDQQPLYVELPSASLDAALPLIVKAVEEAKSDNTVTAISVAELSLWQDQAGEFLLTLENSAGAKMTFGLKIDQVMQLSAWIDTALRAKSGSSRSH